MGKRKDPSTNVGTGKEVLIWNHVMDNLLIDALVHQHHIGNRVGGIFTSKAYDNIVKELLEKFPEKRFDKDKIKNRIKYIKKGFGSCYDIFKNHLSGFSWDPVKSMWGAEPEVLNKLVEVTFIFIKCLVQFHYGLFIFF
jgi:Myb/SANT-like DNA-binding domain